MFLLLDQISFGTVLILLFVVWVCECEFVYCRLSEKRERERESLGRLATQCNGKRKEKMRFHSLSSRFLLVTFRLPHFTGSLSTSASLHRLF